MGHDVGEKKNNKRWSIADGKWYQSVLRLQNRQLISMQVKITGLKLLSPQNSIAPTRIFLHVNGAKKSVEKKA